MTIHEECYYYSQTLVNLEECGVYHLPKQSEEGIKIIMTIGHLCSKRASKSCLLASETRYGYPFFVI